MRKKILKALLFACFVCLPTEACRSAVPTPDSTYGLPVTKVPGGLPRAGALGWIWAGPAKPDQTVYLRKAFSLNTVPASAICYVTVDDSFILFINGAQVDQTRPAPAGLDSWQDVHRIDIAPYLVPGRNVIAVEGHNAGGVAGVVAEVMIAGKPFVQTSDQWKACADAAAPDSWNASQFDDSAWPSAAVVAPLEGGPWSAGTGLHGWPDYLAGAAFMQHLTLPVVRVLDVHPGFGAIHGAENLTVPNGYITITPASAAGSDPPSLVVDFGKEIGGRILVEAQTKGTVLVGTGESYEEATIGPWQGQTKLALAPGEEAVTPSSGFRFAKLVFPVGDPAPIKIHLGCDQVYYPVTYRGSFDCSDPLLTKIWYTGAYTAHLCMLDYVVDGVKRDRGNWAGDARVTEETINNVFADSYLIEHSLHDLRTGPQRDRPETSLPYSHINGIPGYSCAWVCELADFHRHVGDRAFLMRQHDLLISLLEYMRGDLDAHGLFANRNDPKAWLFSDWSPGYDAKDSPDARAATHLYYVKSAREAAFLLQEMGDPVSAHKYAAWAETLSATARKSLASPDGKTFGGRLQENAMAIYSGAATPSQRGEINRKVLQLRSGAWNKSETPLYNTHTVTPYFLSIVMDAMSVTGSNAGALQVLREYWGGMMAQGATTFWEAYDPHWPKRDFHRYLQADYGSGYGISLCHGWSSGATNWLTERILGVRPTAGGFRTVDIAPDLCGLAWAGGTVPTPHGPLRIRVSTAAGRELIALHLPARTRASIGVPGAAIFVNGVRQKPSKTVNDRAWVQITVAGDYLVSSSAI